MKLEQYKHKGILTEFINELERAQEKHPEYPTDVIHQVAIMGEESGEAIRAAIQYVYEGGSLAEVRKELIQTAATCMRAIINLPVQLSPAEEKQLLEEFDKSNSDYKKARGD